MYICSVKFFPSVHELIYCRCRSSHCLGLSSPIPLLHYQSQLCTSSLHQSLTRGITVSFWKVTNFGKRSHLIFVYTIEYDYFMESTTSFQKICVDHDPKPFSIDTYVPDIISVWTFSLISVTFIIQITFNLCSIVRSANMCEELELSLHHFLYDVTGPLTHPQNCLFDIFWFCLRCALCWQPRLIYEVRIFAFHELHTDPYYLQSQVYPHASCFSDQSCNKSRNLPSPSWAAQAMLIHVLYTCVICRIR